MALVIWLAVGNIPAYAGKAPHAHRGVTRTRKHPRIRGESERAGTQRTARMETSPHTRGKLHYLLMFALQDGNIPAYAGKAIQFGDFSDVTEKHPRIRGESSSVVSSKSSASETSPHTRGKLCWLIPGDTTYGNIPAYAGKANVLYVLSESTVKHPRIRGESQELTEPPSATQETSPHTRGKPRIRPSR